MVAWSVAVNSAETGPGTTSQISAITSAIGRPDLAISDGLVVTPSTIPVLARSRISATSAVSMKNFIAASSPLLEGRSPTPIVRVSLPHHHATGQPPAGSCTAATGVHVRHAQRPVQVAAIVPDPRAPPAPPHAD